MGCGNGNGLAYFALPGKICAQEVQVEWINKWRHELTIDSGVLVTQLSGGKEKPWCLAIVDLWGIHTLTMASLMPRTWHHWPQSQEKKCTFRTGQPVWADSSPPLMVQQSTCVCGMKEPINEWTNKLYNSRTRTNMVKGTETWEAFALSMDKKFCDRYQEERMTGELCWTMPCSEVWLYSKGSSASSKVL